MKRLLLLLALLPLPSLAEEARWPAATLRHSASFNRHSTHTGRNYRILLGLPHTPPPASGYPVLWVLDGQALLPAMEAFRSMPPGAQDNPQQQARLGSRPPGLIVAIAHASGLAFDVDARALDYTPAPRHPTGDAFSPRHGGADRFLRFLVEELRPEIARQFPLDDTRHTLLGFSYGGLFTLHVLQQAPQHFQRYWAASPSLWFSQRQLLADAGKPHPLPEQAVRIMLSVGEAEQYPAGELPAARRAQLQQRAMIDNARNYTRSLRKALPAGRVELQILPGRDHHDMMLHAARHAPEFAFSP